MALRPGLIKRFLGLFAFRIERMLLGQCIAFHVGPLLAEFDVDSLGLCAWPTTGYAQFADRLTLQRHATRRGGI
jgi:hypothetical protein